ncbi:MAG TPA: hypothetical protein VNR61_17900 [Niallia sp.]|nr:hypothetical protein [Niallia sp.]
MVRVALNYAIMLEQVKQKGYSKDVILQAFDRNNLSFFKKCGNGIPDWETLLNFYENNEEVIKGIIEDNYEITFLTKGTLKRLLLIKYGLLEGSDYEDEGEKLITLQLAKEDFSLFSSMLAKNWTIVVLEENRHNVIFNIELTVIN